MGILVGLNTSAVMRLKKTWTALDLDEYAVRLLSQPPLLSRLTLSDEMVGLQDV